MKCRHCKNELKHYFLDLGSAPPSNAYLNEENINKPELFFPLRVKVCEKCWLVQTEDYADADKLFDSEYAYFSSTSESFLKHAHEYSHRMINELKLTEDSFVVEIASNDGYLLKNFVENNIPCLGIEPTDSTANAAEKLNIETIREFFGHDFAKNLLKEGYKKADLILGNNVYAHVPDINDFTQGIKELLSHDGVVTLEFPQLLSTIKGSQFDQIYHEHFSYLSLTSVQKIFAKAGLDVFKVDELSTHGGSLRVYGCHKGAGNFKIDRSVVNQLKIEEDFGLKDLNTYIDFQQEAECIKYKFLEFLLDQKKKKKRVCAYGAAAKGNTLLNYAGIKNDLIEFVCDAAPSKQNKFLPGSHIPILHPSVLEETDIDFIVIFPWNITDEIISSLGHLKEKGTKFVKAVPSLTIL
mgnify:CR=1 FL=1